VLSDTHGLLRDEVLEALEGADVLFHAGDVGSASILDRLESVAPLHAVRGNTDFGVVAERLPLDVVTDLDVPGGTLRIYMKHIREDIDLDPVSADIDVVITGHTHRPLVEEIDGVLWLNPGSCGPRRFDLPVTVALLGTVTAGRPAAEIVDLER
jgi:putative phosphoesterase